MNDVKFSIIVANYNNGHFFKDCCQSLIAQTEKCWEAIIIDDKSTDDSITLIQNLIKDDSRFRFYQNQQNMGYQKTLIKGIELSNAPLFARLDPDDALAPEAIEKSIEAHVSLPDVGLVYSNFTLCDENLLPVRVNYGKQIDKLDLSYLNFATEISHFASFKKSIYEKTSGINPFIKRAEDKDIYMKMCEVAPVKYINNNLYLYRVHNQSLSSKDNVDRALFWHWVAIIKMSERTGMDIEGLFNTHFIAKNKVIEQLRRPLKSKWARIGYKLGLFKAYKNLQELL